MNRDALKSINAMRSFKNAKIYAIDVSTWMEKIEISKRITEDWNP